MKSYGRASGGVLGTLLDLRVEGERQAERALAAASAAARAARAEEARLAAEWEVARAALATVRRDDGPVGSGERAAEGQARRRFWARLEGRSGAAGAALADHRANALARALEADAAARAAHVRARQRREVVEKAVARRQAAARLVAERRAEAIQDDRATRARTNTPAAGK
jgi:hypothetical protein